MGFPRNLYRHKVSQDKRISWHNDYESLQKFIECVFAQQGKWKSAGGTSKKFVSSIADLSCTWYPGKLNSLLFHGKTGDLVNEILVTVCKSTSFNTFENSVKVCVQNIPVLNSRDTAGGMTNLSHTHRPRTFRVAQLKICANSRVRNMLINLPKLLILTGNNVCVLTCYLSLIT